MSAIHFDITANGDHFVNEFNRVRDSIKKTIEYIEKEAGGLDKAFEKAKVLESLKGKIDLSKPMTELGRFDEQVQQLCKNLDQYFDGLQGKLKDMASVISSGQSVVGDVRVNSDNAQQIADLQKQNDELLEQIRQRQAEVEKEREAYNQLADAVRANDIPAMREYSGQLEQSEGRHVRIRTEIMNCREELMKMIDAGQRGTPEFQQLAEHTGKMRRELALANATIQYFADPNRHLHSLKTGLQGVAGAAGLVTGVLGVFNEDSEKMAQIQSKVASIMAVIVGLETTYNLVKKTSNVMLAIEEVRTWAAAKARGVQATATVAATAAQEGLNTAMRSNPIGAIISLLAILGTAIYAVTKAIFTETDAEKKAREEKEAHIKAIKEQHEQWAKSVADSASKQLTSYNELQRKWNDLGDDFKAKERFVKDNQEAFHNLGFAVGTVTDAESLLVKNTDAVVTSIMARTKALAYQELATDELKKRIEREMNDSSTATARIESGQSRLNFRAGMKFSNQQLQEIRERYGVRFNLGDNEGVINEREAKALNQLSIKYQAAQKLKTKTFVEESEKRQKALEESMKKELATQKEAARNAGLTTYNGGKDRSKEDAANARKAENEAKKLADAQQKMTQLVDKQKRDEARKAEDVQFSTREAEIKAMRDSTDKAMKQIELDHDRELAAIRRSYEDLKIARIEEARKLWEADPKNDGKNFYESDKFKATDWDATYTAQEAKNRIARENAANVRYAQAIKERQKQEQQYLYDYLKEYGSIQQQREAVTKEYDKKIADAQNAIQREALEQQKQQALAALDFRELQNGMDWERVFGDLDRYSTSALKDLKGRLREALDAKDITVENAKILAEKINELEDRIITRSDAWTSFLPILRERKKLTEEAMTAEQEYQRVVGRQREALSRQMSLQAKATSIIRSNGIQETDLSSESLKALLDSLDPATEAFSQLKPIVDELSAAEVNLTAATDEAAQAARKKASIDGQLKDFNSLKQSYQKGVESAGGEIQWGLQQAQQLNELIDTIGLHDTEFGRGVAEFTDGTSHFASAIQKFQSGDFVGATTDAIKGIQDYGHLIERIGGFSFNGGNEKRVVQTTERLIKANEALADRISDFTDAIDKSSGMKAVEAAQSALDAQKELQANNLEMLREQMGYHSAHHSNVYYADDEEIERRYKEAKGRLAKIDSTFATYNVASLEDVYKLIEKDPAYLKTIKDYAPDLWEYLTTVGKYDKSEYWENVVSQAGVVEQITEKINNNLTQTSFDSLRDSYLDALTDMDSSSEDFAKSFENMMFKAVMNSMVLDSEFNDWLAKWQEDYANAMTKNDLAELEHLRIEAQRKRDEKVAERDRYALAMGYQSATVSDQSAAVVSADKITYEQADQIEGQLTAIQISGEQRNQWLEMIYNTLGGMTAPGIPTIGETPSADLVSVPAIPQPMQYNGEGQQIMAYLDTLNSLVSPNSNFLQDIRNMMMSTNEYLLDIKRSNREILNTFGEKIDNVYKIIDDRL